MDLSQVWEGIVLYVFVGETLLYLSSSAFASWISEIGIPSSAATSSTKVNTPGNKQDI